MNIEYINKRYGHQYYTNSYYEIYYVSDIFEYREKLRIDYVEIGKDDKHSKFITFHRLMMELYLYFNVEVINWHDSRNHSHTIWKYENGTFI